MRLALLLLAITISACASPAEQCRALEDDFHAALAEGGGTCDTNADCHLVGGSAVPSCDCHVALGDCAGTPIATNAPGYPRAIAIERQFSADCTASGCRDGQCVCDCPPAGNLRCEDHHCTASARSCSPPDAAP
jgi:hypothetical protein